MKYTQLTTVLRLHIAPLFLSLKLAKDIEIIKSNGLKEMKTQVDIGSNFYVQAKMYAYQMSIYRKRTRLPKDRLGRHTP